MPDNGLGETNATSYTVTDLTNDAKYSFPSESGIKNLRVAEL